MRNENSHLIVNSFYNLVGQLIPIVIGFITIPTLIHFLGMGRFGLLSLLWAFLGYLAFFDLGLSRAIIKLGAELKAEKKIQELPQSVWTTIWITLGLTLIGATALIVISKYLVQHYFNIPIELESEGTYALTLIALSLPVVTLTSVFRGALESQSHFFLVNILQSINGGLTYLTPLIVAFFSPRIDHIIIAISCSRLLLCMVHGYICILKIPGLSEIRFPSKKSTLNLVNYGSWLTVSNIISPIMVYFDRFLLGSIIPVSELAYYTTPYEVITRVLILPSSVARTLFPAFSSTLNLNPDEAKKLYPKIIRIVAFIMALIATMIIAFSKTGLYLWLGNNFSLNSTYLLQIFSIGIFFNAIANIPYTFIQSAGRPDLTAKIHIIELPIYLSLLWYSANKYGAVGAAWSWSLRLIFDCFLLLYFSKSILGQSLFRKLNLFKLTIPLLLVWYFNSQSFLAFISQSLFKNQNELALRLFLSFITVSLSFLFYWFKYLHLDEQLRIVKLILLLKKSKENKTLAPTLEN